MCGIAGYIDTPPGHDGLIDAMTDALAHRGPDGRGVLHDRAWGLALGHRRLSIIDPAGGAQPMRSRCGRYAIVFNGEIYNHAELRDDLASRGTAFRTRSDTEILLEWLARHGLDGCDRLNGMFAFAFADLRDRILLLARDPIGEKPLYYAVDGSRLAFGSELKSLLLAPWVRREIDPVSLHHYLSLNYVPGERSMIEGIRRCPPGAAVVVRDGRVDVRRYYQPRPQPRDSTPADAADHLGALLDDAVRLRLRSDVPVGAFLSSGVDSGLIASSIARARGGSPGAVTLFSAAFDDPRFDESGAAEAVARMLGLPFNRVAVPDADETFIDAVVDHADDPLGDSSAVPTFQLCRAVSGHCKVALGGDGADELFGGYLTHRIAPLAARYRRYFPKAVRNLLARTASRLPNGGGKVSTAYCARRFFERVSLGPAAHLAFNGAWIERDKRDLYDPAWSRRTTGLDSLEVLAAGLGIGDERLGTALRRVLDADIRQYLPDDILVKTDRMSMACGLEVRSPFLDRRIVGFALGLPPRWLSGLRRGKVVPRLLAARRGLGAAAARRKQGFSVPIHAWLRGPLRGAMLDLLSPGRLIETGVFNPRSVAARIDRHLSGRDDLGFELWGLMILMAWWRRVFLRPGFDVARPSRIVRPVVAEAGATTEIDSDLRGASVPRVGDPCRV